MNKTLQETKMTNAQSMLDRYHRAEAFEHESLTESMVLNSQIFPHWIGNSHCFWYIRKSRRCEGVSNEIRKEFRLVNADNCTNIEAFNHSQLSDALTVASGESTTPDNLPIKELKLDILPLRVTFIAFEKHWIFDPFKKTCEEISVNPSGWLLSPDGRKAAFLRNHNLWVRDIEHGDEKALTKDGEQYYAYGALPERLNLIAGFSKTSLSWVNSVKPEVLWSPDSKKLLVVQTDERQVLSLPTTEYVPITGGVRPRGIQTKYALPGDQHIAKYRLLSINIESGHICDAHYPRILDSVLFAGLFSGNRAWWSKDSDQAYFIDMARGQKQARVMSFNILSGETQLVFEETSNTYIDLGFEFESPAYLVPLPETRELIWFSERSGWAHLYLYDMEEGVLKNAITSGDWLVRDILHVDTQKRELLIQVAGRLEDCDPYYREICNVNIDTGAIVTIASGDHDNIVTKSKTALVSLGCFFNSAATGCGGVSTDGSYIVTTRSRPDQVPTTELIDREGKGLLTVEIADLSGLPDGWQWPEPVKLLAADGKTTIHGLVFKPQDFSPEKKYPVLDWAGTNCFYSRVPKGAFHCSVGGTFMSAQAYAELGFITVMIDGRGSCYRSKDFHDEAYGRVHSGSNLEDHIVGIRQLAERCSYMDLDRVGITDTWGSNAPVYGLLEYPDFYKVGAATSVWDVRLLTQGETYQGLVSEGCYDQSILGYKTSQLKGKLLLIQGMLDAYFHVSGAFQLVDALVKENKDFDLVLLPNGGHALESNQYGLRRSWDYLVEHLLDERPPVNFHLSNGFEFALEKKSVQ